MLVLFNDSCSKCAGLAEKLGDAEWTAVRYLDGELSRELLDAVFDGYDGPVSDLVRTGEAIWAEVGVDLAGATHEDLKTLILDHPVLLQRPIILKQDKVILARVPDRVWDTLGD